MSLQAMAGAPILHMACVLPRIDSGAGFMAHRVPVGHAAAAAHSKPRQPGTPPCANGPSLRTQSETANNTDLGGASGGFFNEAEAGAWPGGFKRNTSEGSIFAKPGRFPACLRGYTRLFEHDPPA